MALKSRSLFYQLRLSACLWGILACPPATVLGVELPPAEDLPEEVLRTEIITEARSPIDGQPLTAAEYAELQAELRSTDAIKPKVSPKIQRLILLLRVRKVIKSIAPFLVP